MVKRLFLLDGMMVIVVLFYQKHQFEMASQSIYENRIWTVKSKLFQRHIKERWQKDVLVCSGDDIILIQYFEWC